MTGISTRVGPAPGRFEQALGDAAGLLPSDPAAALERAKALTAANPDARAFRVAAKACRALGRTEEAAVMELQAIKFGFTPPLRRAVEAEDARQSAASLAIAEEYLREYPDDLLAQTIAATAAMSLGETDRAQNMLRRVLERAPAFPRPAVLLANSLAVQLRLREAIAVVEELLRRIPGDPVTLRLLAEFRGQRGDYREAAALYEPIIASSSASYQDLVKHAQNLRAAGQKAESIAALRRAISVSPHAGPAWWALAQYFPDELADSDVDQLKVALARAETDVVDAGLLLIALSIVHDRRGQFETAFQQVSAVKVLRAPVVPYSADSLTRHVDELIEAYSSERLPRRSLQAPVGATPIFIVGMPRSGSTLIERILGSHSQIEATGEIQVMPRLIAAEKTNAGGYGSLLPETLTTEKLAEMGGWYIDRSLEFRRTERPFFVDKYNANWVHTGLIRLMFPDAKILDVRRGPVDCCWSVFKMMYGDPYANDQRSLARYYADYARFMDAMAAAAPDAVLRVGYEDLVDDIERETARMLSFIGVGHEPECTRFHVSEQPVATPSSEQVRRPLFRSGIGGADPYRPWLGPLVDELRLRGVAGA